MPMNVFKQAFRNSLEDLKYLIKNQAGILLGILCGIESLEQFLNWIMLNFSTDSNLPLYNAILLFLILIIGSFLIMVFVFRRLYEKDNGIPHFSYLGQIRHYFLPMLSENLRATGYMLLWMLLFILPGLYKYVRYSFVSLIVLLDPEYEKGQVDALEESQKQTKSLWLPLLIVFMLFAVIMWWLGSLQEKYSVYSNLPVWLLIFASISFLEVFLNVLLYEIYSVKKSFHRRQNGTHV